MFKCVDSKTLEVKEGVFSFHQQSVNDNQTEQHHSALA